MNKLYHKFCVYSYKGGELCSNINNTLEEIAFDTISSIDWEDLFDWCSDDEKFKDMSDDEYCKLTCVQLLNMISDESLKDYITKIIYPGNIYAYDTKSDSEIYTTNDEGKLVEINIVEEPGFLESVRKALFEDAEWTDNYHKEHQSDE